MMLFLVARTVILAIRGLAIAYLFDAFVAKGLWFDLLPPVTSVPPVVTPVSASHRLLLQAGLLLDIWFAVGPLTRADL